MSYYNDFVLYGYAIYKDYIELYYPGGYIRVIKENDIKDIKQWIQHAKKTNCDPCNYVNYMIKETW